MVFSSFLDRLFGVDDSNRVYRYQDLRWGIGNRFFLRKYALQPADSVKNPVSLSEYVHDCIFCFRSRPKAIWSNANATDREPLKKAPHPHHLRYSPWEQFSNLKSIALPKSLASVYFGTTPSQKYRLCSLLRVSCELNFWLI